MGSRKVVLLLGTLLLALAWREADGRARAPLATNEMAVEIYDGYITLAQGSANGVPNLRFLLDTGATDSAIDRTVAEKLGLRIRPTHVTSFDKTVVSGWALTDLTFGPEHASNARVMIEDLSYLQRLGIHIDGVIGLDWLRRRSFAVNYARQCITFGPVETAGMRGVPMLANETAIRVEAKVDGRPVWMAADTGAPTPVLYEESLDDLAVSYRLESRMDWLSVGGHVESHMAMVPRFQVGGQDLSREVVLVSVPRAKRVIEVSGYFGIASLGAKEVVFDFDRNQLFWKK